MTRSSSPPSGAELDAGRGRELAILNRIAEALNSTPNLQEALRITLQLVAELLGLKTGWVWLLDDATGQFYSAAALNLPPYLQDPVHMTGKRCWCIDAFLDGQLAPKNVDVMECSRLQSAARSRSVELTHGLRYHASIPLYFRDRPLGIMNVTGPSWRQLGEDELRLLATAAFQIGIAIERARLAEEGARLARMEERARIAREIHDTLAQDLTAIGLQLESALRQIDQHPGQARERVQRALSLSRESLEEARRSVLELRGAPLGGKPLGEALASFARAFTSETGVRVALTSDVRRSLPSRIEGELYRIAQEALSNVRKHARAREVRIAVSADEATARLAIRDDGRGFDPRAPSGGHGIVGMRERARLLGGTLRLSSRPGRGTSISVTVPLGADRA